MSNIKYVYFNTYTNKYIHNNIYIMYEIYKYMAYA